MLEDKQLEDALFKAWDIIEDAITYGIPEIYAEDIKELSALIDKLNNKDV